MPRSDTAAASQTTLVSTSTRERERTINFAPAPSTSCADLGHEGVSGNGPTAASEQQQEHRQQQQQQQRPHIPRALCLVPVKLNNLPRKEVLIAEAEQILYDSQSWKPGKVYNGIRTYSHTLPTFSASHSHTLSLPITTPTPATETPWYCVAHEFPSLPPPDHNTHNPTPTLYTKLWSRMSRDRIRNQQQYTPEITSVNDIKTLSRSQSIWSVSYDFGSPLSPRVFTMLQIVKLVGIVPGTRTGIAITIPVDLKTPSENLAVLEDLGVKGRCVTAEHLKEYDGGRIIEWRKVMCGEFGGLVPRFCVRRSMPEKMAQDAQRFLQWIVESEDTGQQQEGQEGQESEPKLEKVESKR